MTNDEGLKPEGAPERSPKAGVGAASGVDVNDRAAKLAAIPAGESPANRRRSSRCCSYIQQRGGRPIR